jgi:hypothetical protein
LLVAESSIFGVREQTIQAARHMPNVERDRSGSRRPSIHFAIGKIAAPFPQIFVRELQGVQNGAPYRRNIRLSAP